MDTRSPTASPRPSGSPDGGRARWRAHLRAGTLADFYRLLGDLARRGGSATIVAFDVLAVDDEVVTGLPFIERRALLEKLDLSGFVVAPSFPGTDLDPLLKSCGELGMEGIVLKRLSSIYCPGQRRADWRKVKCPAWREQGHLERRDILMG